MLALNITAQDVVATEDDNAMEEEGDRELRHHRGRKALKDIGNNLGYKAYDRCEGDCDSDKDCRGRLKCFKNNKKKHVPGCKGTRRYNKNRGYHDYCYKPRRWW